MLTEKTQLRYLQLRAQAEMERRRRGLTAIQPRVWTPLDWQVEPFKDRYPIVLLTGSKGGGKSHLAAEKIHAYCLGHPGVTSLAMRKTRESMTNSTALFLEREIVRGAAQYKMSMHRFEYPNGAILAMGGMADKGQREQVRSIGATGGLGMIWMEEANAFTEEDFNEIYPTLRAAADYRQLVMTTNPDSPNHWIYKRMIQGQQAHVYYSSAQDNTHNPPDYVDSVLARISGTQYQRLVLGHWVAASGTVYEGVWDEQECITEDAEYIPDAGPIYWATDDGYSAGSAPHTAGRDKDGNFVSDSHPRVFLLCQMKPDGHLDVFYENAACLRLADEHINEVLALPYPRPDLVAHGPGGAEFRGRLMAAGLAPRRCDAQVETSIQETRSWIAKDANGFRRLRVHPRCRNLISEMVTYANDPTTGKPIKEYDHSCDASRYLIWALRLTR